MSDPTIVTLANDYAAQLGEDFDPYFALQSIEEGRKRCAKIPVRYADAVVTVPEVAAWVRALVEAAIMTRRSAAIPLSTGPSLLLLGPTGVGKTRQLYGAARALAETGVGCRWVITTAADAYAGMRIDKDGMPTQSYAWSPSATPPERETQFNRDVWANRAGETYHVSAGAAFTRPLSTQVTIPPAKTRQPPPPPVPDPHRDRIDDKENPVTYPPALVAERYVNPETTTAVRLLHVPAYFERVHFIAEAFQGGKTQLYPATIGTDESGRRYARAEVMIKTVDPASFLVEAIGNDDDSVRRWLLVEAVHDGKVVVTGDKPAKPSELVQWQFSGLSRNLMTAWAASDVFLNGRDPKALTSTQDGRTYEHGVEIRIEGTTTWYALVYQNGADNAHQGIVVNPQAQPGPYTVQVAQEFVAGHREIITGATSVPNEVRAGKPQFTTTHRINLAKLGDGDTIVHTINFGEGFEQTNTNYTYDAKLKTIDPATGKPVKPTLQEAQQLTMLKNEYHFVRHTTRLELHTLNPHTLRGNSRFQPIYIVTVFPVEDDASYSGEPVPEISEELVNA